VTWSIWHRGSLSIASTVVLANVLSDEDTSAWTAVRAVEAWGWTNALLWGPELFGPVATKVGFKGPAQVYGAVAAGYVLGVAGTFAAIELTADSPEQKASMQADAKALFLPQFLGGESWEELDYFGTLVEGGKVVKDEITRELAKYWNITAPRRLTWWL